MSAEENKSLVRRYVEQILNRGNMVVADELLAPDYKRYISPAAVPLTAEIQKQRLAGIRTAFPDWHLTPEDMIAEGDRVAFRGTIRGTHQGAFCLHEPRPRPIAGSVELAPALTQPANERYREKLRSAIFRSLKEDLRDRAS